MARTRSYCTYLLVTAGLGTACQHIGLPIIQHQPNPRTVLVEGEMRYPGIASPLQGFEAVFVRSLQAPVSEQIVAKRMAVTGRYKVRLLVGQLYYIRLSFKAQKCVVETQEFAVTKFSNDTVLTKNFYVHSPDSTDYGGCLAGWHPPR